MMRLYELLLKYRSLVIALGLVTSLGLGLLIHLGSKPAVKTPPAPPAAVQKVEIHPQPKQEVVSRPNDPLLQQNAVSPRLRSVRSVNTQVEPAAQIPTGQVVPVIVERRRSAVVITQAPQAEQGSDSGTQIQARDNRRLEPRKAPAAATDGAMPFFAPPAPPDGGINALVETTSPPKIKEALSDYIRTYYPLLALDAASIDQLNEQGKTEYARQKAAFDKELSDVLGGSIYPTSGEIPNTFPEDLIETLREADPIESQDR